MMGSRSRVRVSRKSWALLVVAACLLVLFPTNSALATFSDSCNEPSNGVGACLGVKGSGLYVDYVDMGAWKPVTSDAYLNGYVDLCWFEPGAAITGANCYMFRESALGKFYAPNASPYYWMWDWQQNKYRWCNGTGSLANCPSVHWGAQFKSNFGNNGHFCTRVLYNLRNVWYYSTFRCATIHS